MRLKDFLGHTCEFKVHAQSNDAKKLNYPSKSFMEALGHEGLNKMLDGFEDRTAEAVCTFAFCRGPGEEPIIFQGRTEVSCNFVQYTQI